MTKKEKIIELLQEVSEQNITISCSILQQDRFRNRDFPKCYRTTPAIVQTQDTIEFSTFQVME